jgi:hypothetical protein
MSVTLGGIGGSILEHLRSEGQRPLVLGGETLRRRNAEVEVELLRNGGPAGQ